MKFRVRGLFARLFWVFWCAQLLTLLMVGGAIALLHVEHLPINSGPGAVGDSPHLLGGLPPAAVALPAPDEAPEPFVPVLPLLAGMAVSMVFAGLAARQLTRPLKAMHRALDVLPGAEGAAQVQLPRGWHPREVVDLARHFNAMSQQLHQTRQSQRRLLRDVSHELRSPLARVEALVGLMQQQPSRMDELSERAQREAQRMNALIEELLLLARLDASVADPAHGLARENLVELVDDVVQGVRQAQPAWAERVWWTPPQDPAWVWCRAQDVVRAVDNLLGNALVHAGPQAQVSLSVRQVSEHAFSVVCEDDGPGVGEADVAQLFEPFYRTSGAGAGTGHGLGLAIVRRVAEGHGGRVQASRVVPHGLRMELQLPTPLSQAAVGGST